MPEALKALARAIAAANGHPDPDAYAEAVSAHFAEPVEAPAAPVAPVGPVAAAPAEQAPAT